MTQKNQSPRWGVRLIILIAVIALTACNGGAGGQVAAGGLQVWLDQPPDGSSIPLAMFTLKAHARDEDGPGIQAIAFYVNDIPLASVSTDPSLPLVYAETAWNPAAPGLYEITAEASNGASTVRSAVAHVCVGDDCEGVAIAEVTPIPTEEKPTLEPDAPTFTPIASLTTVPTRTPSATPTAACTQLAPPNPTTPTNGDAVNTPNPTLSWTYPTAGCQPQSYKIELCSDEGCTKIIQTGATGNPSTSWSPATAVADCSIIYWRVAGLSGNTTGPFSTIFHFATAFPGGCGTSVDDDGPTMRLPNKPTETGYGECGNNQNIMVINVDARDETGVKSLQFDFRYWNGQGTSSSEWIGNPMTSMGDNIWQITINHNDYTAAQTLLDGTNGSLEFQIIATDTLDNVSTINDHTIQVIACGKP